MNKHFTYNFIEKTIIGSHAAIIKANKGLNPEYSELSEMLSAHPEFSVKEKVIQKKEGKKTYGNLTLNRMKEYIETQYTNKEELNDKLNEFKAVKKVAEAKGAIYPLTKKWFLETYPEYKKNNVSDEEINTENEAA